MRERRERELSKNLDSRSQINSDNNANIIDNSDQWSTSFKSYVDNQSDEFEPYSQTRLKGGGSPTLINKHINSTKLENFR